MSEWSKQFLTEPEPEDSALAALAMSYYERAEAYDCTVCTGPMGRDGVMPANYREMGLINRNAASVLRDVQEQAQRLGYTREQLKAAMLRAGRSPAPSSTQPTKEGE
jgi:hypothetical protein